MAEGPRQLVRWAGELPEGEGRLALPPDDPDFLLAWLEQNIPHLHEAEEYWAIFVVRPIPGALKGAPGEEKVRTGDTVRTLRRWQANKRMRRVATAFYPGIPPAEAVRRWYEHGGTMQPLRWSDSRVAAFAAEIRAGQPQDTGDGYLYIGEGERTRRRRSAERRRYRGEQGSARRDRYNALRREQRARRRLGR